MDNKDFANIIAAAKEGDRKSLETLIWMHFASNEFEKVEELCDIARSPGYPIGYSTGCVISIMFALALMDLGAYDGAIDAAKKAVRIVDEYCARHEDPNGSEEAMREDDLTQMLDNREEALFLQGCAMLAESKFGKARQVLNLYPYYCSEPLTPKAQMLIGLCLFYLDRYGESFGYMDSFSDANFYKPGNKTAEILYMQLMLWLEQLYLHRSEIGGYDDIKGAHDVIEVLKSNTSLDGVRETAQERLAHYHQNMFGRWKYV